MMDKGCDIAESSPPPHAGIRSLETNTFNGACHFAMPARNNNGAIKSKSQARGLPQNFTPVSKYLFWRERRSQSAGILSNLESISPVHGEDPAQTTENGIDAIPLLQTASSSTPTVSPVRFIGDETMPSPVQSIVDETQTMPSASHSLVSFIENETMPHGCTFDISFMTSDSICVTPNSRVAASLPYMMGQMGVTTPQTYSGVTKTGVGPVVDQDGPASEDSCNDLRNRTFTSPLSSTLETKSQSVFGSTHTGVLFESHMSNVSNVNQNTFDVDSPSNIINQTSSCKNNTFDIHQPCPSKCNDAEPDAKMALLHNTFDAETGVAEVSEAGPRSNAFQTKSLTTLSSTTILSESSVNLQKTFDMVSPNKLTSHKNVDQPCSSKCNVTTTEAQPNAKMSHLDNTFDAEPGLVAVSEVGAEPNVVRFSEARAGSDVVMVSEARAGSDVVMVSEARAGSDVVALAAFAAEPNATVTVTESGSSGCSDNTHTSTLGPEGLSGSLSQSLACNLDETLDLREFLPSTSTPQLPQVNIQFIKKQAMGKSSVVQRRLNEPDTLLAPPTNLVGDRKTLPSAKNLLPASKLLKCGATLTPHFGLHRRRAELEAPRNAAGPLKGATGTSRSIVTPSAQPGDTVVSTRSKIPGAGLRRPSGLPVTAFRPPLTRSMTVNESTGTTGQTHTDSAVHAVRTGQAKRHVLTSREPLPGPKRKKIGCANCAQTEMKLASSQQENKRLQEELQKLREERAGWNI